MKNKRIYIAQNETRFIKWVDKIGVTQTRKIRAKLLTDNTKYNVKCECPCNDCTLKNENICFIKVEGVSLSLPTRPACMGNDPENLINMPLIYVNEK